MKLYWVKPENPSLWIFGITSMVHTDTEERTFALHLGRWTVVLFPKS